jgi:heme O synthase-like polyprenyltransferase
MSKKRLNSNLVFVIIVLTIAVLVAIGFPSYSGTAFVGAIILILALLCAAWFLWKAGYKRDTRTVVAAQVFEDARTREKNRKRGVTSFSIQFQDGSMEVLTVRDDSEEYKTFSALGKPRV